MTALGHGDGKWAKGTVDGEIALRCESPDLRGPLLGTSEVALLSNNGVPLNPDELCSKQILLITDLGPYAILRVRWMQSVLGNKITCCACACAEFGASMEKKDALQTTSSTSRYW